MPSPVDGLSHLGDGVLLEGDGSPGRAAVDIPSMKSYSRDAKKEKIQAKRGGLTPGTPTSKEQELRENRRIFPFSCVLEVEHIQTETKDDI